jgi:hypothetical protein
MTKAEADAINALAYKVENALQRNTDAINKLELSQTRLQTAFEGRCQLVDSKFVNVATDIEDVKDIANEAKAGIKTWNVLNSLGVIVAAILALFLK